MRREIASQLTELRRLPLAAPRGNAILIGSGDSYAACMLACYLSDRQVQFLLPTDVLAGTPQVLAEPHLKEARTAFFVSVSGMTNANLLAARSLKERGYRTVAVTRNKSSSLARICDEIIELKLTTPAFTTAGTLTFTSALMVCCSICQTIRSPKSLSRLYREADHLVKTLVRTIEPDKHRDDSFILLGQSILYPVAMYGAMKLNEVIGARAFYYNTEEFCHSPIFGLKPSDVVICLEMKEGEIAQKLDSSLEHATIVANCRDNSFLEMALKGVFFVQLLSLYLAERRRLSECYFLSNKKLLSISSTLIY